MKNKFKYLVNYGFKRKTKSKWFKIINILLLFLIPLVFNIDKVVKLFGGDFSKPTNVYVIENMDVYEDFEKIFNETGKMYFDEQNIKLSKSDKSKEELEKSIEKDKSKDVIIEFVENKDNIFDANVISYETIGTINLELIKSSINTTKTNIAISRTNIDKNELNKIYSTVNISQNFLNKDIDENEGFKDLIGGVLIPIFVVPFFFLIIITVQSVGTEINEEKTSKSMEIIISSVDPKTHFLSKIVSINLFVLLQGLLLLVYIGVGFLTRFAFQGNQIFTSLGIDSSQITSTFIESGVLNNVLYSLPFIVIIFVLSFLAYSLLAGILASMTTSMEDYQQLQTPLMIILLFAYYLSIIASVYESATFIKVASYVPFISGILSPVLLILGQISVIDTLISMVLLIITCYLLLKYGIKIYKVGILNYSSSKLWKKMANAVKEK